MFSIAAELRALLVKLDQEQVPYALCGALALAVYGHPRATLDIDLLALGGSAGSIRRCGRSLGFLLEAAPMQFAGGTVRIERLSKVVAEIDDVLMLDVLILDPDIEREIMVETVEWQGIRLVLPNRESLIRLKMLRASTQDLADVEKLAS